MTDLVSKGGNSESIANELDVEIQYAFDNIDPGEGDSEEPPSSRTLSNWAKVAYSTVSKPCKPVAEATIRIVADAEMRQLNHQFRAKNCATNVLSFPFENEFEELNDSVATLLGDIVICHQVVVEEAYRDSKSVSDHYAHMVTHGVLHLCGFDHQDDLGAEQMETLEAKILAMSNISNPYASVNDLN